ncbi:MAG TPA: NAD(P)/FAD-dependent oxidoreductase [Candidatus Limnocylindria bacterium]|nr:NAD(P)/FAD-dependent oxidoreductase [Candidatus Limnocylindria bacterium]
MSGDFDLVVIGAGASGEAAANYALDRGLSVAVVDRDLFGGTCAFWGCMPSKALLHAAEVHHRGGEFPWPRASRFRDWMIVREPPRTYPDDARHIRALEEAGATAIRGTARFAAPGTLEVAHDGAVRTLRARDVVIAVGSVAKEPPIPGLAEATFWTNKEGTSLRELPRSIAILGAGPSGVELAQVYARYGVRTTIVSPRQVNPTDHPRSSALLAEALRADGVDVREHARAERVRPRAGDGGAHAVDLADGSTVTAEVVELNVGRTAAPALRGLGLDRIGVAYDGADALAVGDDLRVAEHVFAIGDAIGRELSTHLGHYEGEVAVRVILGEDARADFGATPRCVYTDPETAAVGLLLEQARERGIDAAEETADLATSAKGYVVEGRGHVSIVVDRKARTLAGAFIGGPGAAEAIHEAVLAVKLRTPLAVLADTIHAFPTTARVMGGLFAKAALSLR